LLILAPLAVVCLLSHDHQPEGGIALDADVIGPKYLITEFKDLAKLIAGWIIA